MDFLAYVHQLHLRLLIRNKADSGKEIVTWAESRCCSCSSRGSTVVAAQALQARAQASGRRFWFDLHNAIGIFSLVVPPDSHVYRTDDRLRRTHRADVLQADRHPAFATAQAASAASRRDAITADEAMDIARRAIPGTFPFQISVPGPNGAYQIRSRFPEDLTGGGRSRVTRGPVHRRHPLRRRLAHRARRSAHRDRKPRPPHRRNPRRPDQDADVAGVPDGGSAGDQRNRNVVEANAAAVEELGAYFCPRRSPPTHSMKAFPEG